MKIQDNDPGCNSQGEVELECATSINETSLSDKLILYPNPFSTSTTIEFELSQPENVRIEIYNSFGKQIEVIERNQGQGLNKIVWTPINQPNGIYHFRLQAGEQIASGKMVLMR